MRKWYSYIILAFSFLFSCFPIMKSLQKELQGDTYFELTLQNTPNHIGHCGGNRSTNHSKANWHGFRFTC